MADDNHAITKALATWSNRGRAGLEDALPVLYPELRKAAESFLSRKRSDLTISPETLAQELSMALASLTHSSWENRRRFFKFVQLKMMHILSDHAERKDTLKRGGQGLRHGEQEVSSEETAKTTAQGRAGQWHRDEAKDLDTLAAVGYELEEKELEHLLSELFRTDKLTYNVVVLRVAGFSNDQIAAALNRSPATIDRRVELAKRAIALAMHVK